MSFSEEGSACSDDGRMLSPEVRPIGESSNDDHTHPHGGSDVASNQVSDICIGDVVSGIVIPLDVGPAIPIGGVATRKGPHPYFGVRLTLMEDEAESPRPNPPQNVIDLDLETTIIQVLLRQPFVPPFPLLRKNISAKGFPPIVFLGYSWVHEEVGFFASSFLTYKSIVEFLELVKFGHVDRSNIIFIESCQESERTFICAFLCETHFMYMYSSFFSTLYLIVPFDKFEVDVLRELNFTPT